MECDWWSLGVILFECLCGYPPFDSDDHDPQTVCKNIINWKNTLFFSRESCARLSKDCINFVKSLICNPDQRLGSIKGAVEIKSHRWFTSNNVDFEHIRELEAPYVPEFSEDAETILKEKLPVLNSSDKEFKNLLKRITSKFDDYPDEPLPVPSENDRRRFWEDVFIGYTFKPKVSLGMGKPPPPMKMIGRETSFMTVSKS